MSQNLLKSVLLSCLFLLSQSAWTQNALPADVFCLSDLSNTHFINTHPALKARQVKMEKEYQKQREAEAFKNALNDTLHILPVVVHIIHDGTTANISDAQVLQGIEDLNAAFANLTAYDPSTGFDTQIQFCLAQRDPAGNATSGITRTESALTNLNFDTQSSDLYNLIHWDSKAYINIRIVNSICNFYGFGCVAGYASSPGQHGLISDGLVVRADKFGTSPQNSTLQVHEMGHYLGLFHTFFEGCDNDNCLADGDRVCDTPPDNTTIYTPCGEAFSSCDTDVNAQDVNNPFATDQSDMYWNYMDYGGSCYSAFTEGQIDRMCFFIENVRSSLLDSKACFEPCPFPLAASISPADVTIDAGTSLTFSSNASNADIFNWQLNGNTVGSEENLNYLFTTPGEYTLSLTVESNTTNCFQLTDQITITIQCPVNANFMVTGMGNVGETVSLVNTSTNKETTAWFIEDTAVGNDTNLDYTFSEQGNYEVCLVAADSWCSDTLCQVISIFQGVDLCDTTGNFFQKEYYFANSDCFYLNNLKTDIEGNIFVLGEVGYYTDSNSIDKSSIMKLNVEGEIIFEKNFLPANNSIHSVTIDNFIQTIDSSYLVGGKNYTFVNNGQFLSKISYISEFDANFAQEWNKEWKIDSFIPNPPFTNYFYTENRLLKILPTSDGGFFTISSVGPRPHIGLECIACKFNMDGEKQWCHSELLEGFFGAEVISDSSLIYGGFPFDNSYSEYLRIVKVTNGTSSITKQFNNIELQVIGHPSSGICRMDTNLNIVLLNVEQAFSTDLYSFIGIAALDDNLEVLWTKKFQLPKEMSASTFHLNRIDENSFYLTFGRSVNIGILKFDREGNLLFSKRYNTNNYQFMDYAISTVNAEKELFIGFRKNTVFSYSGLATTPNFTLLKLDSNGYGGSCNYYPLPVTLVDTIEYTEFLPNHAQHDWKQPEEASILMEDDSIFAVKNLCTPIEGSLAIDTVHACSEEIEVVVSVCNLGGGCFDALIPVAFYDQNPTLVAATPMEVLPLGVEIPQDSCSQVSIMLEHDFSGEIFVVLNDSGEENAPLDINNGFVSPYLECNQFNNFGNIDYEPYVIPEIDFEPEIFLCPDDTIIMTAPAFLNNILWNDGSSNQELAIFAEGEYHLSGMDTCGNQLNDTFLVSYLALPPSLELGNDVTICTQQILTLSAGSQFDTYLWNDFSTDSTLTAWQPGKYWVDVWDSCGNHQTDTINITLNTASIINLGENISICEGQELSFEILADLDTIRWYANSEILCENCESISISPQNSLTLAAIGKTTDGCFSSDTINIQVYSHYEIIVDSFGCDTDFIIFNDVEIIEGDSYTFELQSFHGCDSFINVSFNKIFSVKTEESITICEGESTLIFGSPATEAGIYTKSYIAANGCDSTHQVELLLYPELTANLSTVATCPDEATGQASLDVESGTAPYTYAWSTPNESIAEVNNLPAGNHQVTITDANNCQQVLSFFIENKEMETVDLFCEPQIYAPNVFSPNGDSVNDFFYLQSNDRVVNIAYLRIFDRFGELVFENKDFPPNEEINGWNGVFEGELMNPQVFIWQAEVTFLSGERKVFYGDVVLVK